MMRYSPAHGTTTDSFAGARRGRFDGYQFSLFPPPAPAAAGHLHVDDLPYSFRAVAPRLRPLVVRYNNRCPDCAGPLVSGEGAIACPVCGFRRLG